jgi:hypothetical protein
MSGFVETGIVESASVYTSPVAKIETRQGYSVYLYQENLSGTVDITVYASCHGNPDTSVPGQWAEIHTVSLASSAYLLNVEVARYTAIYIEIDATSGSFDNGYLRVISQ